MAIQLQGFNGVVPEVESANRALRVTHRPLDYGALGIYSMSTVSGIMAAGLGAGSVVYSFRWTHATNLCLLRSVRFGAGGIGLFSAGIVNIEAVIARSFTAFHTGGTAATLSSNQQKRRTTMATTSLGEARIASTAALAGGTLTLDSQGIGNLVGSVTAVAGTTLVAPGSELVPDDRDGRHPVVLTQNEGFVIRATVPATGTWTFGVSVDWEEAVSF